MPIQVVALGDALGAEIRGVDLSQPVAPQTFAAIHDAWMQHEVLVFRGQTMTPGQQIAFTRLFGELVVYTRSENALPGNAEVLVLSNVVENGRRTGAAISGRYWHVDGHFLESPPAGTLLYAREVPLVGGDTWFTSMTAAYAALPDVLKDRIAGRRLLMSRIQSLPYHYPERPPPTDEQRRQWPDVPQLLVRTHPGNGRKALFFGGIVPWRIVGMAEDESNALMAELHERTFQERFMYVHRWQAGDVLLWDNRATAHRATGFDMAAHRRTMHRTSIAGDVPF
ncbi:MAG TPA: TauD/TfdA family dioxygenase [Arenibaculum sp.]|nr:TauD/TfdA family dioxygenase [Arenibaculum sp.]